MIDVENTKVGVWLSVERYNALLEAEYLAKYLPNGVLLHFVHYEQTFMLYASVTVTLNQLAEVVNSLFRLPRPAKILRTSDGTLLEPHCTIAEAKLRNGDKLFVQDKI